MKNNFEHIIKESLNNYEVPYEAGAWEKFEKKLTPSTPFYKSKWFIGVSALVVLLGLTAYLLPTSELKTEQPIVLKTDDTKVNQPVTSMNLENVQVTLPSASEKEVIHTDTKNSQEQSAEVKTLQEKKSDQPKTKNDQPLIPSKKIDEQPAKTTAAPLKKPTEINSNELVSASFYLEKTICQGNLVNLIADDYNPNYNYVWTINNESLLKGNLVNYKAEKTGLTIVTLSILNNKGEELTSKTTTIDILEAPSNSSQITLNESSLINTYTYSIFNTSESVEWNFGDGNTSTDNNASHTYKKAGIYKAVCHMTSTNGCKASFEKTIEVAGYYNLRPDYGFSPNGDNINDFFIPEELKLLNKQFDMSIYSRNGKLVYRTTSIDKPWNGKLLDGSMSSFGTYAWVVSLTNEFGEKEIYKGTVTNVSN